MRDRAERGRSRAGDRRQGNCHARRPRRATPLRKTGSPDGTLPPTLQRPDHARRETDSTNLQRGAHRGCATLAQIARDLRERARCAAERATSDPRTDSGAARLGAPAAAWRCPGRRSRVPRGASAGGATVGTSFGSSARTTAGAGAGDGTGRGATVCDAEMTAGATAGRRSSARAPPATTATATISRVAITIARLRRGGGAGGRRGRELGSLGRVGALESSAATRGWPSASAIAAICSTADRNRFSGSRWHALRNQASKPGPRFISRSEGGRSGWCRIWASTDITSPW